jgi:uncharacterized membrane protein YeaQ/YmgE (transglycosylase-associated protein family)
MPGQESLLFVLGVGLAAGWLAAKFVKGHGLGLVGDIVVGVAGSYLGHELLPRAGVRLGSGAGASIVAATIGAAILLFLVRLIRRI